MKTEGMEQGRIVRQTVVNRQRKNTGRLQGKQGKAKAGSLLRHAFLVIAALFLILGLPVLRSDAFRTWIGGADTVTGATVILEQPSGEYVVLINRTMHEESGTLPVWTDFFTGKDIPVVFEDLHCITLRGDAAGLEIAKSLQSRLPENQMALRTEEAYLALSKAACGKYDILLLSKEAADAYDIWEMQSDADTLLLTAGDG